MTQGASALFSLNAILPPAAMGIAKIEEWNQLDLTLYSRTPTGPPHSSTLLYETSLRIRL
jgi:hypothetical protein